MRWWVAAVALGAASPAAAEPVYLSCHIDMDPDHPGGEQLPVEISADEPGQKAIIALPTTGRVVTRQALFSPTEVKTFDAESLWIINREDLSMQRRVTIGDTTLVSHGRCTVKPAPKQRAF